ncbi:MAG: hypothetical protein K6G40_10390 [Eubacterium sp.]|nr:hypothetical protein [Eubacterium sp.]
MAGVILWLIIIALIVYSKSKKTSKKPDENKEKELKAARRRQQQKAEQAKKMQQQKTAQAKKRQQQAYKAPQKRTPKAQKPSSDNHYGMEMDTIHAEVHGEHVHDEDNILCRANIDNEARHIVEDPSLLGTTEDLMICGYDGSEFLDRIMKESYIYNYTYQKQGSE